MKKIILKELVKKTYKTKNTTLIGVGPMSSNVIDSCFELAKEYNFPLMFIASRNQIDLKEYGGGYVNGWDQYDFVKELKKSAKKNNFYHYYVCRDHGGPWQRDEERNNHLPVEEAMELAKKSFAADIEAGFDLLMVDPTKDPFVVGKVVDMDFVLDKTVELIEFCEEKRKELHMPPIDYEVGTEETNGGLTDCSVYETFIKKLDKRLKNKGLPTPVFVVGQTGTLVKSTMQAGSFDFKSAKKLSDMAAKYDAFLKEHNADYLDVSSLICHIPSRVSAANVAPEFGTEETRGYLELIKVEQKLYAQGLIKKRSNLYEALLDNAIKTERWKKWVSPEKACLSIGEIKNDEKLSHEILEIAGHYTLNNENVKNEIKKLYNNLKEYNINGEEIVKENIKKSIKKYINSFNLKELMTRID